MPSIIIAPPQTPRVFLCAGQSNMVGQGYLPTWGEIEGSTPNRQYIYTLGGVWARPIFEPSHTVETIYGGSTYNAALPMSGNRGASPLVFFANRWIELKTGHVAVVPSARNGTPIAMHAPSTSTDTLFGAGVARVTEACQHGVMTGILWSQGEADAKQLSTAEVWAEKFIEIVEAWRAIWPGIPVVFARLGLNPSKPSHPHWDIVREQQGIAASTLTGVAMVDTDGIERDSSKVHYTTAGQQIIGERMAEAMAGLVPD